MEIHVFRLRDGRLLMIVVGDMASTETFLRQLGNMVDAPTSDAVVLCFPGGSTVVSYLSD